MEESPKIPDYFFEVNYNGAHYPGSAQTRGLEGGANCQVFIYEVLRYLGFEMPDLRSSELWADLEYSRKVEELQVLDILFWHDEPKAWGAHVGLYWGEGKALHLAKSPGYPVIWSLEKFKEMDKYRFWIGAKRLLSIENKQF